VNTILLKENKSMLILKLKIVNIVKMFFHEVSVIYLLTNK